MDGSICPACGFVTRAGDATCSVCRAPVFPEEAARLGLDAARVHWSAKRRGRFTRRWIIAATLAIAIGSAASDTLSDSVAWWAGLPVLAGAAAAVILIARRVER